MRVGQRKINGIFLLSFLLLSSMTSLVFTSNLLILGWNNDEHDTDIISLDGINPLSSGTESIPAFTEHELINNPSETVTFLDFYNFQEDYASDDVIVGLSNETTYLFRGIAEPWFAGFYKDQEIFDGQQIPRSIVGAYGTHINGIEGRTTDVFMITRQGSMFHYKNDADDNRNYYQGASASWQEDDQVDISGNIWANTPRVCIQTELGGKYALNDEFVVGLGSGDIYYIITQDTEHGTADTFKEKLINDDQSSAMIDLEVGDLDNDGDMDVIAVWENDEIYAYENDGTPGNGEWSSHQLSSISPDVISLDLADVDLDGQLDIITGANDGEVRIWQNDGSIFTGTISTYPEIIDYSSYEIYDVKAADFDNDGDYDIAATISNGSIAILENPLHQPFIDDDAAPFSAGNWEYRVIASHSLLLYPTILNYNDMDLDGDIDILAGYNDGTIYGYENTLDSDSFTGQFDFGPKEEMYENSIANSEFNQLTAGDVDNDGDIDVALSTTTSASVSGRITVLENPGDDSFRTYDQANNWNSHDAYSASGADYYDLHFNDIDSDGNLDIAFISDMEVVESIENDGTPFTGSWSLNTLIDTSTQSLTDSENFVITDIDKDGAQEIIWTSASTGTNQGDITAFRNGSSNVWATWSDKVDIAENPTSEISKNPLIGYFDNDNFLDIAVFDGDDQILLIPGNDTIDSIIGEDISIVWDGSGDTALTTIALSDIDSDQRSDILFASSGSDKDARAILNDFSFIANGPNWNSYDRCASDSNIDGMISEDVNMDGVKDVIFWTGSELRVFEGNNKPSESVSSYLIEDLGSTIKDAILCDVDLDGDDDIVVITSSDVYYFPNRLRQDINLPDIDLNLDYDGNYVNITVTSNETVYRPPEYHISVGSSNAYGIMTVNPSNPLEWSVEYYVAKNGTYDVVINTTDIFGNFVEVSDQFVGYHYLSLMNITIQGPLMEDVTNDTVTITLINKTLDVYSDYGTGPADDLLVNITDPSVNTEWIIAQYQGGSKWNFTYTPSSEGTYTLGLNITDADGFVYSYIEKNFEADFTDPGLTTQTEPDASGEVYYQMDGLIMDLEFDEPIKLFKYYFTRWNESTEVEDKISDTLFAPGIAEDGNQTIQFEYEIPDRQDGDINITIIYFDLAGNSDVLKVNFSIIIYLPVLYDFYFRDLQTLKAGITETNSENVLIAWTAINCTVIQYKVDFGDQEGTWSEDIPYNDIDRLSYAIPLGSETGEYNVTVRFYNYHNYVEKTHQITYIGPSVSPFPWWWFVIAAAGLLVGYIIYKVATKPKEKSWKRYLDQPIGDIK